MLILAQAKRQIKMNSDVPGLLQFSTDTMLFEIENTLIFEFVFLQLR